LGNGGVEVFAHAEGCPACFVVVREGQGFFVYRLADAQPNIAVLGDGVGGGDAHVVAAAGRGGDVSELACAVKLPAVVGALDVAVGGFAA